MASTVEELIEELKTSAAELGLYARETAVGTPDNEGDPVERDDIAQAIKDGRPFMIAMTFMVGDLAWTDRIQNPELFLEKQEFRKIVPNVGADVTREELEKRIRGMFGGGEKSSDQEEE